MKNIPLLLGTILGTLALVVGVAIFFSNTQSTPEQGEVIVDQNLLLEDARHRYGPEDASIIITEFSDFSCPFCRAVAPLVKQVANQYPEDVSLVFRHFPLGSFAHSQLVAQASEYMADQGLFWEFHDLVYQSQTEWSQLRSQSEVIEILSGIAQELGIDITDFEEKIQLAEYSDRVLIDRSVGNAVQVSGTPTLFVNGQRLSAPDQLPQLVEALLAENAGSQEIEMSDLVEEAQLDEE